MKLSQGYTDMWLKLKSQPSLVCFLREKALFIMKLWRISWEKCTEVYPSPWKKPYSHYEDYQGKSLT